GMAKPLTTPDERVAFFQQIFSDLIPHNKALGLKVVAVAKGLASMQLDWREELVGNPETGVLAGGPLTAMLDGCCGIPSRSRRSTCASTTPSPPSRANR